MNVAKKRKLAFKLLFYSRQLWRAVRISSGFLSLCVCVCVGTVLNEKKKHTHTTKKAKIENKCHFCGNKTENHWCVKQGRGEKKQRTDKIKFFFSWNKRTKERKSMQTTAKNVPHTCVLHCFKSISFQQDEREKQTSRLFSLIYIKLFCIFRVLYILRQIFGVWCKRSGQAITRFLYALDKLAKCGNLLPATMTISLSVFCLHEKFLITLGIPQAIIKWSVNFAY